MDRLQTLILALPLTALAYVSGCDTGKKGPPPPPVNRVESVAASQHTATESDLCDVVKTAGNAPTFAYPPLDSPAPKTTHWRWVNLWASWCGPCVEEMPLITRLRGDLEKAGLQVELVLLSVDQTPQAMAGFQATHPEAKGSLRLSDFNALEAWLPSVGLDAGATLPIHLFVDPSGKMRCARTGAVRDTDLPLLKRVISG